MTLDSFAEFGLSPALNTSLNHMKYTTPTPIQAKAIPLALNGHDIMGTAQTGTGKTAAFAIPLVERLLTNPYGSALVLTPTRELGKQIMDIMRQLLGPKSEINTAFIIGGEPMGKQFAQLRAKPRLIVGTPGRINDHLNRGTLKLDDTHFLVLDETDRMLDMGFTIQLEEIFKYMPEERQTLMFSATLPKNILKLSEQYLTKPQRVAVGEVNTIAKNIKQDVIRIEQDKKYDELMSQLYDRTGSVIVFVKTKFGADRMAKNLRRDGFTSEALHGDLKQNKRDKVMQNFRKQNFRVLIATDIAARGLDVPHIEHVINFDLPQVAEDYIHRMGRTARAGAEGSAVSFVASQDGRKWHAIERLLNPKAANDSDRERKKFKKKKFGPKSKGERSFDRKPRDGAPEDRSQRDAKSFRKPRLDDRGDQGQSESRRFKKPKENAAFESDQRETKSFRKPRSNDRGDQGQNEAKSFKKPNSKFKPKMNNQGASGKPSSGPKRSFKKPVNKRKAA